MEVNVFPKPAVAGVLTRNYVEARLHTDAHDEAARERVLEWQDELIGVKTLDDAKACAEHLMSVGFRRVILTLGSRGAMLASQGTVERIPPFQVDAVDTTGAGDAFIGSFASFLAEGYDERDAVAFDPARAELDAQRAAARDLEHERHRVRGGVQLDGAREQLRAGHPQRARGARGLR